MSLALAASPLVSMNTRRESPTATLSGRSGSSATSFDFTGVGSLTQDAPPSSLRSTWAAVVCPSTSRAPPPPDTTSYDATSPAAGPAGTNVVLPASYVTISCRGPRAKADVGTVGSARKSCRPSMGAERCPQVRPEVPLTYRPAPPLNASPLVTTAYTSLGTLSEAVTSWMSPLRGSPLDRARGVPWLARGWTIGWCWGGEPGCPPM